MPLFYRFTWGERLISDRENRENYPNIFVSVNLSIIPALKDNSKKKHTLFLCVLTETFS